MAQMRNAAGFAALLKELNACPEAYKWAHGKTFHRVWQTCDRADWLLWLCEKMVGQPGWPTRKELVLAACACAETSLKYVKAGEDRPRKAIETARAWVRGEVSIEDVGRAAYAAYAAAYAAAAAAYAAYAYAAYAAAYAAYAAAAAYAAYAAAAAAYAASLRRRRLRRRLRRLPRQGARRNGGNRPRNNQGTETRQHSPPGRDRAAAGKNGGQNPTGRAAAGRMEASDGTDAKRCRFCGPAERIERLPRGVQMGARQNLPPRMANVRPRRLAAVALRENGGATGLAYSQGVGAGSLCLC